MKINSTVGYFLGAVYVIMQKILLDVMHRHKFFLMITNKAKSVWCTQSDQLSNSLARCTGLSQSEQRLTLQCTKCALRGAQERAEKCQ